MRIAGTDDYLEAERVLLNETNLELEYCKISDLSPLASLKNLNYLWLLGNNISDLTPLQELTNITDLEININQISDISPLQALTNLTELNLSENQINDITPLNKLNQLTVLVLDNNYINDISPLKNLHKLVNLGLSANNISDFTPLYDLGKLSNLDISYNQITDLKVLQPLKYINKLCISGNPISGLIQPTHLIEKYKKLLSIPLNRQKTIESIHFTYSFISLNPPKVIFASNYKSWYSEIINLLKSNNIPNQSLKSFILQKKRQVTKIQKLIFNDQLDYLHHLNKKIPNKSIEELTQYQLNKSIMFIEVNLALYLVVRSLAFNVLNNSSLKPSIEAYSTVENIISPEQIIHQIYLIEVYQSLFKIPLDEKTQQWYDCLNQLFEHCGWFIPFEDVCIVCVKRSSTEGNRPSKCSLDSENRLHAEGEAAIQFADGYGLYYYHGVAQPYL
ncbi:MAG: leucine-rich repeat domain-containing protein [Rivularia sp. (in: cyanobacteria)]